MMLIMAAELQRNDAEIFASQQRLPVPTEATPYTIRGALRIHAQRCVEANEYHVRLGAEDDIGLR